MEELIESYSELIRTLSRLANNNKELLLKSDIKRLEKAKTILSKYAESGAQWQRSSRESSGLNKPVVINRRELLIDFLHWYHEQSYETRHQLMYPQIVDEFEKIN